MIPLVQNIDKEDVVTLTVFLTGFLSSPILPASSEADELQPDKSLALCGHFLSCLPSRPAVPSGCVVTYF